MYPFIYRDNTVISLLFLLEQKKLIYIIWLRL